MELDRLPHFVALAETLHFGRAAEALGMDQAQLSRSIRRLEDSIGAPLFDRSGRRVSLTPSGAALLDEARPILEAATRGARRARRIHSGEIAEIKLTYATPATYRLIPKALRIFSRDWPDVRVRLVETPAPNRIRALRAGEADAVIIMRVRGDRAGLEDLGVASVEPLEFILAVPDQWPIAAKASVRLAELQDLPFVMFYPDGAPKIHDIVMAGMAAAGLIPRVVQYAWSPHVVLAMVAEEIGVALTVTTAAYFGIRGVKLIPIEDLDKAVRYELLLVWNPETAPRSLLALVDAMEQVAKTLLPATSTQA